MAYSTDTIRDEFDRIAHITNDDRWTQNGHYHDFLLRHVPLNCRTVLEIGCGTGAFARQLAKRSESVLALDLSPEMIRLARERSRGFENIDFQVADVAACELPSEEFDCIATIATLHHLSFAETLSKMKRALKPNGVLLVLDLVELEGIYDALTSAVAVPVSVGLRLLNQRRLLAPAAVRAAWAEHEQYDSYLTLSQVRAACAELLPGALIRKHLLWRYSVVWKKVVV
jgi:ubiquinone/menaquinone biosynthesis C-methylase UbiE